MDDKRTADCSAVLFISIQVLDIVEHECYY